MKPKKKKDPERQRLGKLSRTKGYGFEREIAVALRPLFPDARRRLENHRDDANGVDLMNVGRYQVQCKRGRKYANPNRIEEVTFNEFLDEVPVLITAGDRKPTLVVIPLEEFMRLVAVDLFVPKVSTIFEVKAV